MYLKRSETTTQLVTTGQSAVYEELKASIVPGLLEMLSIPGLGPKKIKAIHELTDWLGERLIEGR